MKEKDILKSFKQYLQLQENFGHLTFIRLHTGGIIYPSRSKQGMVPNKDMIGCSDIHILARGNAAYLELKRKGGKLTLRQRDFLLQKKKHGAKVGVAYSLDEAISFTEMLVQGNMDSVGI